MLSKWCNLFAQDGFGKNYFKLGGPRSFHHFLYKNTNIILMGEAHTEMINELAQKYLNVMNQFIERHPVTLFIESTKDDPKNLESEDLSFIDCMRNLNSSDNLETIHSDRRHYDKGFKDFFLFLNKLTEVEEIVITAYKERNKPIPSPLPFFSELPAVIKGIYMIAEACDKSFSLSDLLDLLDSHTQVLAKLHDIYSQIDIRFGDYLADCILNVNDTLGEALELQKKYQLMMQDNDEKIDRTPLIQICIDMMCHEKTFSS